MILCVSRAGFNGLDPLRPPPVFLGCVAVSFWPQTKGADPDHSIPARRRRSIPQHISKGSCSLGLERGTTWGTPPSGVPQKGTFLRVTGTPACAQPRRPSHPLRVLKGLSVHGAAHRRFQPRAGRGMMTPPAGISISLNFLGHGRADKISPRSLFTAFPPQGL